MKKYKWIPCRACGTESIPGYRKELDSDGREILKECECHKIWRERICLVTSLKKAHLPFSDFMLSYNPVTDYLGDSTIPEKIIKLSYIFEEEEALSYLVYFYGNQGTQKTTIAWWIGIQAVKKNISVYYVTMQKLLEEIIAYFNEEKYIQRKLYENISLLIIDDSFSKDRVTLFKNKNYQLAPLNALFRERSESSVPKHTLIISDTPVGNINSTGFGNDIEYLISSRGSILTLTDEFNKEQSKFNPRDIFKEKE